MKLLKIEGDCGHFHKNTGDYSPIDTISKEDLMVLVHLTLEEDEIEFDEYDEKLVKNQAHQVIYKSIVRKLQSLRERRQEFIDESARLYLDDYDKYKDALSKESASSDKREISST